MPTVKPATLETQLVRPVVMARARRRVDWTALLLLLPAVVLFLSFTAYPVLFNFVYSFHIWNGLTAEREFIGLQNYIRLLNDPVLRTVLRNIFYFSSAIFIQMAIGLPLAVLLDQRLPGSMIYRSIITLPVAVSGAVIGIVFRHFYGFPEGLLNNFLRSVGLFVLVRDWLGSPTLAIWSIIAVNVWQWTGFSMLLYLAGLQLIPSEVYESAKLDGASALRTFFSLTVPLLSRTHIVLIILGVIGVTKTFDIPFLLTGGGPYHASEMPPIFVFSTAFNSFEFGYAATIAVFFFIALLVVTGLQIYLTREERV